MNIDNLQFAHFAYNVDIYAIHANELNSIVLDNDVCVVGVVKAK